MNKYRFHLLLFLLISFSFSDCFAQKCDSGTLNLGTIDEHWTYKNEDLKISFQLPEGWYMFDYPATEKKYLKIGSDYRKMSEVLFAGNTGPLVDISELKGLSFEYALTLLSLAKLQDTASVIPAANEIQQNYTLSLRALYADSTNIGQLLKNFYKKFTGKPGSDSAIKDGKLGELEYRYILLTINNKSGKVENRIFGIRNFGCINMIIRITYASDADLTLVLDMAKDLKIGK